MATTTSILSDTIMAQAKAFKEARSQFDEQFMDWSRGIPPLAPEHFWPMVDDFRKVLLDTMRYRKEGFVEAAAEEFLRLAVVNGGDLAAAVHFALSWSHYRGKAYAAGDELGFSFERGDDGYGDLMDAVPLLGQEFSRKLETGWFGNLREFNEKVDAVCDVAGRVLKDVVLHGENYFASSLQDAAQKWVVIESRNYGKDGG
jgi:hypothetical protein